MEIQQSHPELLSILGSFGEEDFDTLSSPINKHLVNSKKDRDKFLTFAFVSRGDYPGFLKSILEISAFVSKSKILNHLKNFDLAGIDSISGITKTLKFISKNENGLQSEQAVSAIGQFVDLYTSDFLLDSEFRLRIERIAQNYNLYMRDNTGFTPQSLNAILRKISEIDPNVLHEVKDLTHELSTSEGNCSKGNPYQVQHSVEIRAVIESISRGNHQDFLRYFDELKSRYRHYENVCNDDVNIKIKNTLELADNIIRFDGVFALLKAFIVEHPVLLNEPLKLFEILPFEAIEQIIVLARNLGKMKQSAEVSKFLYELAFSPHSLLRDLIGHIDLGDKSFFDSLMEIKNEFESETGESIATYLLDFFTSDDTKRFAVTFSNLDGVYYQGTEKLLKSYLKDSLRLERAVDKLVLILGGSEAESILKFFNSTEYLSLMNLLVGKKERATSNRNLSIKNSSDGRKYSDENVIVSPTSRSRLNPPLVSKKLDEVIDLIERRFFNAGFSNFKDDVGLLSSDFYRFILSAILVVDERLTDKRKGYVERVASGFYHKLDRSGIIERLDIALKLLSSSEVGKSLFLEAMAQMSLLPIAEFEATIKELIPRGNNQRSFPYLTLPSLSDTALREVIERFMRHMDLQRKKRLLDYFDDPVTFEGLVKLLEVTSSSESRKKVIVFDGPKSSRVRNLNLIERIEVLIDNASIVDNFYLSYIINKLATSDDILKEIKSLKKYVKTLDFSQGLFRSLGYLPEESEWAFKNVYNLFDSFVEVAQIEDSRGNSVLLNLLKLVRNLSKEDSRDYSVLGKPAPEKARGHFSHIISMLSKSRVFSESASLYLMAPKSSRGVFEHKFAKLILGYLDYLPRFTEFYLALDANKKILFKSIAYNFFGEISLVKLQKKIPYEMIEQSIDEFFKQYAGFLSRELALKLNDTNDKRLLFLGELLTRSLKVALKRFPEIFIQDTNRLSALIGSLNFGAIHEVMVGDLATVNDMDLMFLMDVVDDHRLNYSSMQSVVKDIAVYHPGYLSTLIFLLSEEKYGKTGLRSSIEFMFRDNPSFVSDLLGLVLNRFSFK